MPDVRIDIKPMPMREALAYWRSKISLTSDIFYALAEEYRAWAFTVSGLAKLEQIMTVRKSIEKALTEGLSFEEWRKDVGTLFRDAGWTGNSFFRLDNIYRTNLQSAYNAGRWQQAQETRRYRPFGMYSAIMDDRVRPTHAAQNGKVYPLDHPYWRTWWPPNGYNCRCTVRTLTAAEVEERGLAIETEVPETIRGVGDEWLPNRPDAGFACNPGRTPYQVDLSKYPEELRRQFLQEVGDQSGEWVNRILGAGI